MRKQLVSWIQLLVGAVIAALATEAFLTPNDVFDGGVTGVGMILSHVTPLGLGLLVALINVPFLFLGGKHLGKMFVFKTAVAIGVFSVMTVVFAPLADATYDVFLATVFGGFALGVGDGLVLRGGACLDGTEIVAIMASRRTELSVGQVVLGINVIIYVTAAVLFGADRGMYSLVMYFITSRVIDVVEVGWNATKAAFVVTDDGEKLSRLIFEKLGRSTTIMPGCGHLSGEPKDVVYCVVTRAEIYELKTLICGMPGTAFTTISDVSEIVGTHWKSGDVE